MAYAFSSDTLGREIVDLAAKILSTIKLVASLAEGISIFFHLRSCSILVVNYNNALFLSLKLMEKLFSDSMWDISNIRLIVIIFLHSESIWIYLTTYSLGLFQK